MGKRVRVLLIIILSIFMVLGSVLLYKKLTHKPTSKELINITSLSKKFMDNYYEELSSIKTDEEKENMLIVISANKIKQSYGAKKIIEAPNNQYILSYSSKEEKDLAYKKLKENDSIYVEENIKYTLDENDDNIENENETGNFNSWGIKKMGLDYAIDATNANHENIAPVTVAVIDSGCDMELFNKYYNGKIIEYYNAIDESSTQMNDIVGHGTHVAGTIAEGTPNNVKIIPVKASNSKTIYETDLIKSLNYVVYYDKADVINLSLGAYIYNTGIKNAIEAAQQKNIIVLAAAGNNNTSKIHYPSGFENTISISSVDKNLEKSTFSNYGSTIKFASPGTDIKSIMGPDTIISNEKKDFDGDDFNIASGTSMATPHASSAAAILKSYNKDLTLYDVIDLFKNHSIDLGDEGWDPYYGYGFISFENAEFCDNTNCDIYNVFKSEEKKYITNFEISNITFTEYNYWSDNNLLNTTARIEYNDGTFEIKKLGELENDMLKITGYDPYSIEEQNIKIKYHNFEVEKTIIHPNNYLSGYEYNIIDENSIEITLYKGNSNCFETLYIPAKIDGYDVVSLAGNSETKSQVFGESNDLLKFKKVVLPSSLNNIGNATFLGSNIEEVNSLYKYDEEREEMVQPIITVGASAFKNVKSLKYFDGIVANIGSYSFSGTSITNIEFAYGLDIIAPYAFSHCEYLKNISIPNTTTIIDDYAFYEDYNLSSVDIYYANSILIRIGKYAFANTKINEIDLPKTLKIIDEGAFYNTKLKNIEITENVEDISETAFSNCNDLEQIKVSSNRYYDSRNNSNAIIETNTNTLVKGIKNTVIPNTVTKIGNYAFSEDLNLQKLYIPNSVVEIGENAFYGCTNLAEVKIPSSVEVINSQSFVGIDKEKMIILTYDEAYAKTYSRENFLNYIIVNPSYISVIKNDVLYFENDIVNPEDLQIKLYYDYGYRDGNNYFEKTGESGIIETISDNFEIDYEHGDDLSLNDTKIIINGKNKFDENFSKDVDINVYEYKIKYYSNDGNNNVKIQGANKNETISLIKNPFNRDKYEFLYWTINEDGVGTNYNEEQNVRINSDLTLYAQWQKNKGTIIFDSNYENGETKTQKFMYDEDDKLDKNTFTRQGYEFIEWNTKADGTGTAYLDEQSINISDDITLYAIWNKLITYNLILHSNLDPDETKIQVLTYNIEEKISKNTYNRIGHLFTGWNTKSDGTGTPYLDEQVINISEDIDLYAQWTPIQYTVFFFSNTETEESKNQSFTYDVESKLNKNTFTNYGYHFVGWNTARDGSGDSYLDEALVKNLSKRNNGMVELFAQWEENIDDPNKLNVSIMGDSLSTYDGISVVRPFYPRGDVDDPSKTWWSMALDELNLELGTNVSWSGSTVNRIGHYSGDTSDTTRCYFKDNNPTIKSSCFFSDYRIGALGENGEPDIIIIYGGSNDANYYLTDIGSFDDTTNNDTTIGAFYTLISKIKTAYPKAKLFGIVPNRLPRSNVNQLTEERWNEFHSAFIQIYENHNIPYTDIDTTILKNLYGENGEEKDPEYFIDGLHPTYKGMQVIKDKVVELLNTNVKINFYRNYDSDDTQVESETFNIKDLNRRISTTFEKQGYNLLGWNTKRSATVKRYDKDNIVYDWWIYNNSGEVNLYAIWEEIPTVTFHSNYDPDTTKTQEITKNVDSSLDKNTFTRLGYIFTGWNTKSDGTGSAYLDEQLINISENKDLYAQWTPVQYTVEFYPNTSDSTVVNQVFTYGLEAKLKKNTFVNKGFKFIGWNTKADGTGTPYTDEQLVKNLTTVDADDIKLYAQWEEVNNEYEIDDYDVDYTNNYIGKILEGTTVNEFKNSITLSEGYTVEVETKKVNGKDVLYTGGKTKIYNGDTLVIEFTNVVTGDINGDGEINSADLLKQRQHLLKIINLFGIYFLASDVNYDNDINSADLLRTRQHLLGIKPITKN